MNDNFHILAGKTSQEFGGKLLLVYRTKIRETRQYQNLLSQIGRGKILKFPWLPRKHVPSFGMLAISRPQCHK